MFSRESEANAGTFCAFGRRKRCVARRRGCRRRGRMKATRSARASGSMLEEFLAGRS